MLGDNEQEQGAPGGASRPLSQRPVRDDGAIIIQERLPGYGGPTWYGEDHRNDDKFSLGHYWRTLLKHWLLVVAAVIVAICVGIAVILLTKPVYMATVTLQIDKDVARVTSADNVRQEVISSEEFFQTQYGILRSRSLAERTIDNLDLERDAGALKALNLAPASGGANSAALRKALTGVVQQNLIVTPVRGSRLVSVAFMSGDPQVSARLANGVAENFISQNLARRFQAGAETRKFLQEQMKEQRDKLEAADRQLAAYATSQQIINIPGGENSGGSSSGNQSLDAVSLMAATTALSEARGNRIRAEARMRQAAATTGSDLPEVLENQNIQTLKSTLAKVQDEYQDRLKTYRPEFEQMQGYPARITELNRQIDAEMVNIRNSLKGQYDVALAQERQFEGQVARLKGTVFDVRNRSIQYDILAREVDTSRQLYESLLQDFKEAGVAGNLGSSNIFVIDRAIAPSRPAKPEPVKIMLMSIVAGLVLGVILVFLVEVLDESIRSPEDVERKLSLPLLGTVPKLEKDMTPGQALADIRSPFAEAYYSVRTALQFSTNDGLPSSILVTSARPSEGKSTSATALAQNFARLGIRTLLIDGDLRNPSLHRVFSIENTAGLSNYLTRMQPLVDLAQTTATPNLFFIPSGPLPPSPAELLAGTKIQQMLAEARKDFDMVIIDGPPVMGLADAPLLASNVAASILVIESAKTGRNLASAAIKRLNAGRARLLGVILTKFDARKGGYGYGYGYGYDYDYGTKPALKGRT